MDPDTYEDLKDQKAEVEGLESEAESQQIDENYHGESEDLQRAQTINQIEQENEKSELNEKIDRAEALNPSQTAGLEEQRPEDIDYD